MGLVRRKEGRINYKDIMEQMVGSGFGGGVHKGAKQAKFDSGGGRSLSREEGEV